MSAPCEPAGSTSGGTSGGSAGVPGVRVLLLGALLAASLAARPAAAFCPHGCVCNTGILRFSCESAGLDVVPFQLNPEAETIILRGNRITTVESSLNLYLHLQSLDISANRIKSLGSKNFDPLHRLVNLNASGNAIAVLGKDAFKGLRALRVLDLSDNHIHGLDRSTFAEMHDLWELHLAGNRLESLQEGVFAALANLRVLRLGGNQLLGVPTEAVARLASLRVLGLGRNLIEEVGDDAFPNLKDLAELTLDNNVLSEIRPRAFEGLVSLERLDLRDNNITAVPAVPLSRLRRLTALDLSGNMFTALGPVAFHSLAELRVLRLNRLYRLTRVDARALADNKRLESVWLEENHQLVALPQRLFQGNPLVSRVSVRGSAIASLEAAHFPLDRLQTLDVAGVPLTCNCSLLWLWLLCREQRLHAAPTTPTAVAAPTAPTPGEVTTTTPSRAATTSSSSSAPVAEPLAFSSPELHPIVDVDGIRCAGPPDLKGFALVDVPEAVVRCEATWMTVIMVTVVVLALFAATCTVLFFLSTGRWCGHDKDASDVSTDSFATQHSSLHSNHLKQHAHPALPPLPAHPALPGGQVMMMASDMKVEPTYATIGVPNGRSNYLDDYKKESESLVSDFAYQRALKNWDSSFNGGGGIGHHTLTMGRAANHHDQIRHNGPGSYGTYHNHYSMAIDMTKKPPHIVYV